MLAIEWTAASGWLAPKITPYQNFSLDPASSVLHYAFTCFEGMKAYKGADGSPRLFRPDMNMKRFKGSATRIALPDFKSEEMIKLLKELVKLEERFIPKYVLLYRHRFVPFVALPTDLFFPLAPAATPSTYALPSLAPNEPSALAPLPLPSSSLSAPPWVLTTLLGSRLSRSKRLTTLCAPGLEALATRRLGRTMRRA